MDLGKGIKDGGGYDLSEISKAEEALGSGEVNTQEFQDVEPMYIEVRPNMEVARTEEYEARMVIVEYDAFDNIVGVELL
jgi:hypothetical protein